MFGLVLMEGMALSGHLSNINEIAVFKLQRTLETELFAHNINSYLGTKPAHKINVFHNCYPTIIRETYMCSNLVQLAPGSRDLSQAEKRLTDM